MKKIFILLLTLTSLYSNGCILSQKGEVKVSLKDVDFKNVTYKAIKNEGKNFKEIMSIKDDKDTKLNFYINIKAILCSSTIK